MNILSQIKSALFSGSPASRSRFIVGISLGLAILFMLALWAGPAVALSVCGILLAMLVGLLVQIYSAVVRSEHAIVAQQEKTSLDASRQMQALFYVYTAVNPRRPLPPMRGMAISPDFAADLISLIRESQPRTIVELGSGVSTIISCYCLEQLGSGSLLSFDHEEKYAENTRANLSQHKLDAIGRVIHAPLRPAVLPSGTWEWYDLDGALGSLSIDLLVVDGPPHMPGRLTRYPALPLLYERLSERATIIVDDTARADEKETVERWLREYPAFSGEFFVREKGAVILRRTTRVTQ